MTGKLLPCLQTHPVHANSSDVASPPQSSSSSSSGAADTHMNPPFQVSAASPFVPGVRVQRPTVLNPYVYTQLPSGQPAAVAILPCGMFPQPYPDLSLCSPHSVHVVQRHAASLSDNTSRSLSADRKSS